jgi:hypothetical protein
MHLVAFGETFNQIFLVLPDPFHQVASYTDVQGAIAFAGKDVHGWLLGHRVPCCWIPDYCLGND